MVRTTKRTLRPKLDPEDTRILGWLLAYPASATAEVAFAFGIHRTTAYRALARMQETGLVQPLTGYGGEARWLLTPAGTGVLAQGMQVEREELARIWQRGINAPSRLLPRLVTIDRLHTFARGFFQHAPVQLAELGHAAIVRWHFVRDWRARGGRPSTARADAALAWTVEDSLEWGLSPWTQASRSPRAEQWEAAFVFVESGLCDADLIRVRMRRLLGYRSSLQWNLPPGAFPPVLILVENERQAEVWRLSARQVVRDARAEPLPGAIAIAGTTANPWQWGWRDLSTGTSIRLASQFAPLPQEVLPPGTLTHIAVVQQIMRTGSHREGPASPVGKAKPTPPLAVFSPRERDVLTLLYRAPKLSAEEIAAVRGAAARPLCAASAERALRDLARAGLAKRDLVAQGKQATWCWQLTEGGLRTVAAIHDAPILHLGRVAQHAQGAHPAVIEERDRFVHERHAAHLCGVYRVVAAFCRAAQATAGAITVGFWEVGRGCERTYRYHGVQRNLRPDAELEVAWTVEGRPRHLRCWLEYDRGTMNQRDLDRKLGAYAAYWESKEWAADGYAALPRLLFIVQETGQERRVREACAEQHSGARLRVLVTTAAHLDAATPFGRVWRQVWPELPTSEQGRRRTLWE